MNTMCTSPPIDCDLQVTLDYTDPLDVAKDYISALVHYRDITNVHDNIRTACLGIIRRLAYKVLFHTRKSDELAEQRRILRRLELWIRIKGGLSKQATAKDYVKWCTDVLKIKS
jgi:hypothetical protein